MMQKPHFWNEIQGKSYTDIVRKEKERKSLIVLRRELNQRTPSATAPAYTVFTVRQANADALSFTSLADAWEYSRSEHIDPRIVVACEIKPAPRYYIRHKKGIFGQVCELEHIGQGLRMMQGMAGAKPHGLIPEWQLWCGVECIARCYRGEIVWKKENLDWIGSNPWNDPIYTHTPYQSPTAVNMADGIAPRQYDCMVVLHNYNALNGEMPTMQIIADIMGVSKMSVLQYLRALEKKGFISRKPRLRRSIKILKDFSV